jgi:anti-anti-sigma factor
MSQGNQGSRATLEGRCLKLQSERINGHHEVQLQGEMDLSVIGLVDREMQRVEATDASKIVLDLDQLEFVDAAGLRLLLSLNARSCVNGGRLCIKRTSSPQVQRMLELTGVGALLPIEA